MFGYVKAYQPSLRVRELEMYKAVYCTLCRRLGKTYGPFSRLTLSYDFTFLALLNLSLQEGCAGFEKKRCAFVPIKKCNYCKGDNSAFDFPAAAAMVMLRYKLEDNIADSKGIKKLLYRMLRPFFRRKSARAAGRFPEIGLIVDDYMRAQRAVEQGKTGDLDAASEPTAVALQKLFVLCSQENDRALARMGYCMGKWIYLLDAGADVHEDGRTGNYNPLCVDPGARGRLEQNLNFCIAEAIRAYELLPVRKFGEILTNILYEGLEHTQQSVLAKEQNA